MHSRGRAKGDVSRDAGSQHLTPAEDGQLAAAYSTGEAEALQAWNTRHSEAGAIL